VGIALALAQIPTGILSDKVSPKKLMLASWFIGLTFAWVMTLAQSLTIFVIGMLCYNLSGFGLIPVNVYSTNVRGKLSVGRAITFSSGFYNLGAVTGPIIGGKVADLYGLRSVYLIAAVIFIFSTIIIFFIEDIKQPPHTDFSSLQPKVRILQNPRLLGFLGILFITLFVLYLPQPLTPQLFAKPAAFFSVHHWNSGRLRQLGQCPDSNRPGKSEPVYRPFDRAIDGSVVFRGIHVGWIYNLVRVWLFPDWRLPPFPLHGAGIHPSHDPCQ
jgi:MFS family permease